MSTALSSEGPAGKTHALRSRSEAAGHETSDLDRFFSMF
jgi:hypothetical protein